MIEDSTKSENETPAVVEEGVSGTGSLLLYGIDDVPPAKEVWALGFQHYLTMFG